MRSSRIRPMTLAAIIAATIVVSGIGVYHLLYDSPERVFDRSLTWDSESGLRFILNNGATFQPVPWSDVAICLQATPANNDPYELAYWTWYPSYKNLTSQDGLPVTYSMQDYWGVPTDVQMFCNLTDVSGDGYVSGGDFFVLTPMSDHADVTGIRCLLELIYEPTDGTLFWLEFTP